MSLLRLRISLLPSAMFLVSAKSVGGSSR